MTPTTPQAWRPSDEQRRAILLVEALGQLHDVGKLSNGFLGREAAAGADKPPGKYVYTLRANWLQLFGDKRVNHDRAKELVKASEEGSDRGSPMRDLLAAEPPIDVTDLLRQVSFQWNGEHYNLAEVLLLASPWAAHTDLEPRLGRAMLPAKLIGRMHGVAHYEKQDSTRDDENDPQLSVSSAKQSYRAIYRATAFGCETLIPVDAPGNDPTSLLRLLPWRTVGDAAGAGQQRRDWYQAVRSLMSRSVADNRRPINEVTLDSWGYTVACLSKAAAASFFAAGGKWPKDGLDALRFRTLAITVDRLQRYSQTDKITDLLGVRSALDDAYAQAQHILEEIYCCGNLFFRDETGCYFLLPAHPLVLGTEQEEDAAPATNPPLPPDLRAQLLDCFPPDLRPRLILGESMSIGELDPNDPEDTHLARVKMEHTRRHFVRALVANLQAQAARNAESPIDTCDSFFDYHPIWQHARPKNAEICRVCGVRPAGYYTDSQKAAHNSGAAAESGICGDCLDRRDRRTRRWAGENLQGTIWTDEVADDNGRLALFVGRLGLDAWLDGSMLQSIVVERSDSGNDAQSMSLNPSPARLLRIAETGRKFWEEVNGELTAAVVAGHDGTPRRRLAIYLDEQSSAQMSQLQKGRGSYGVYDLAFDGVTLAVVWDVAKSRLLTIENLAYFAQRWPCKAEYAAKVRAKMDEGQKLDVPAEALRARLVDGQGLSVQEPSAYGKVTRKPTRIAASSVEHAPDYLPVIPLLAEPGLSLVLVPAGAALKLARKVKAKYESEMGRVRDRLPLHIGLVFFARHTPMRAVLEAGRSMLKMEKAEPWQEWVVEKVTSPGEGEDCCCVAFAGGVEWAIPVTLPGAAAGVRDRWRANFFVPDPAQHGETEHQLPSEYVRYVEGLHPGDHVFVRPSLFDFEFLDTAGRATEIHYNSEGRRALRPTRPYLLDDLDSRERGGTGVLADLWQDLRGLAPAQRYQVTQTIGATKEAWQLGDAAAADPVFWQFAYDTLAGAEWPKGFWRNLRQDRRDALAAAAAQGVLADVVELNMRILKLDEKPKE